MKKHLQKWHHDFKDWLIREVHGPYATWILGFVAFTESSFLPIPPDVLLMPMTAIRPYRWLRYAAITTFSSVAGALLGYLIGIGLFEAVARPLISVYGLQEEIISLGTAFENNAFWTIAVSAFTPLPYKLFTIGAGVFKINIITLVVASVIGRGLRFFGEALLMRRYGAEIAKHIFRYVNIASLVIIAVLGLIVYLLV